MAIDYFIDSYLDLRVFKRTFIGLLIVILFSIPIDLVLVSKNANGSISSQVAPALPDLHSSEPLKPLLSYEEAFQNSRVFGSFIEGGNLSVLKSSIQELTKDLRLKGIVVLDQAEAIIEDARTQKSSFLKAGDRIGELTVKEIRDGEVILTYYGEEKRMKVQ